MKKATLLLIYSLLLAPSCSWITVDTPPPGPPACTSSRSAPIVDGLLMLFEAGLVVAYAVDDGIEEGERNSLVAGNLITGILFGASAVHGFSNTSECEDYSAAYDRSR